VGNGYKRIDPDGWTGGTVQLPRRLWWKLGHIAKADRRPLSQTLQVWLGAMVEAYEEEHGELPSRPPDERVTRGFVNY